MESRVDSIITGEGLVPAPVPLTNYAPPTAPEPEPMPDVAPDSSAQAPAAQPDEPLYDTGEEASSDEQTVDDYGNPVQGENKAVRERLDRLAKKHAAEKLALEHEKQQLAERLAQLERLAQGQPAQPAGDDSQWEAQFDELLDQRLSVREQRMREQQWKRQESESQAQFEVRFNQGAARYQDFEATVVGKPLTPQMVMATRGMQDPAAFIYAAAKTQAGELERISKLSDPYAQAVELGKLEERMRKSRSSVSNAPKPIDAVRGDVPDAAPPKKWSVDEKLRQDEMQRRKERFR